MAGFEPGSRVPEANAMSLMSTPPGLPPISYPRSVDSLRKNWNREVMPRWFGVLAQLTHKRIKIECWVRKGFSTTTIMHAYMPALIALIPDDVVRANNYFHSPLIHGSCYESVISWSGYFFLWVKILRKGQTWRKVIRLQTLGNVNIGNHNNDQFQ
jgi:hypothetical protein